ncbi:hypothetical protein SAMN05660831_02113 [Thiohalospira halophila DSM 15071]|uniref:Uncharacterized protein n=1 Tax=Thiohalospira halophila DSM 15071 TaxID=1123397 RepID=A0A1I1UDJ6_9GAMM|nr:hypothetical protein [Thiohalospira halophila]SFD68695.1 hypothetical protein SAMN05660831_02113 [Thiohalospira halophila DSM 15071]
MDIIWMILGYGLALFAVLMFIVAVVGLVRPSALANDRDPNPTRRGTVGPALGVAVGALIIGRALMPEPDAGTSAESANPADPEAAAEAALRDAGGWGASYEIGEVRSTLQVGDEMLGEVFVDLGPTGSQADAVRTWGQAARDILTEAGEPALEHYDRVLFYLRQETQGGGHHLAAKARWTTDDARDLIDEQHTQPYQRWIDQVHELELKPMGGRAVAAWCSENRQDAPGFCRSAGL